jgi:hypothetical protein
MQAKARDLRKWGTILLYAKVLSQQKKIGILLVRNYSCLHYFMQLKTLTYFTVTWYKYPVKFSCVSI